MIALAFALLLQQVRVHPATPEAPRTVVLIIADDVGAADLRTVSAMGGTPNLDLLAATGFTFNGAIGAAGAPVCSPARRQLYFGDWHTRTAKVCQAPDGNEPSMALVSLPELVGVQSALFGKWHVGANPTGGPWEVAPQMHGFDLWRGGVPHYVSGCGGTDYWTWPRVEDGVSDIPTNLYQPGWQLARTTQYLASGGNGLVVFASHLAHEPYQRPPSSMLPLNWPPSSTVRERYWAMIAALDYSVGRILARLSPDDIVIFTGDNGTPEEVTPSAFRGKSKTTTYERGISVPLIISGKGIPVGSSSALVSTCDLYATIGELFGSVPDPTLATRSLLPLVHGTATSVRDYVFSGIEGDPRFPDDVCARSLQYKLRALDNNKDGITDVEYFYDLAVDPTETVNRIDDPALAATVAAHRAWLAAVRP